MFDQYYKYECLATNDALKKELEATGCGSLGNFENAVEDEGNIKKFSP